MALVNVLTIIITAIVSITTSTFISTIYSYVKNKFFLKNYLKFEEISKNKTSVYWVKRENVIQINQVKETDKFEVIFKFINKENNFKDEIKCLTLDYKTLARQKIFLIKEWKLKHK